MLHNIELWNWTSEQLHSLVNIYLVYNLLCNIKLVEGQVCLFQKIHTIQLNTFSTIFSHSKKLRFQLKSKCIRVCVWWWWWLKEVIWSVLCNRECNQSFVFQSASSCSITTFFTSFKIMMNKNVVRHHKKSIYLKKWSSPFFATKTHVQHINDRKGGFVHYVG